MFGGSGKKILTPDGNQVTKASRGTEALYLSPKDLARLDLAISNQTLQEMMGEVLIGNLQEICSNLSGFCN